MRHVIEQLASTISNLNILMPQISPIKSENEYVNYVYTIHDIELLLQQFERSSILLTDMLNYYLVQNQPINVTINKCTEDMTNIINKVKESLSISLTDINITYIDKTLLYLEDTERTLEFSILLLNIISARLSNYESVYFKGYEFKASDFETILTLIDENEITTNKLSDYLRNDIIKKYSKICESLFSITKAMLK
jgi:hypothetical protein